MGLLRVRTRPPGTSLVADRRIQDERGEQREGDREAGRPLDLVTSERLDVRLGGVGAPAEGGYVSDRCAELPEVITTRGRRGRSAGSMNNWGSWRSGDFSNRGRSIRRPA